MTEINKTKLKERKNTVNLKKKKVKERPKN